MRACVDASLRPGHSPCAKTFAQSPAGRFPNNLEPRTFSARPAAICRLPRLPAQRASKTRSNPALGPTRACGTSRKRVGLPAFIAFGLRFAPGCNVFFCPSECVRCRFLGLPEATKPLHDFFSAFALHRAPGRRPRDSNPRSRGSKAMTRARTTARFFRRRGTKHFRVARDFAQTRCSVGWAQVDEHFTKMRATVFRTFLM